MARYRAMRALAAAIWVAVALGVAALLVLVTATAAASQEGLPDLSLRDRQETVVRMFVRTRTCMRSAGDAAVRRKISDDPRHVQLFMVSVCGDPLRMRLQFDGMGEEQARSIVARIARTSYYEDVKRVPEPPYVNPNNAPKE